MTLDVLSLGDTHSGALGGLTHPDYWVSPSTRDKARKHVARQQRAVWKFYEEKIAHRRYDVVLLGGDLVDGPQKKSDGEGLFSTAESDQVACSVACLELLAKKGTKILGVMGTRYHTGSYAEAQVYSALGCEAVPHLWADIAGKIFDVKHKVGIGGAPSSRPGVRNAVLHNLEWSRRGGQPVADVLIRHHAHVYHAEESVGRLALVCPGMQLDSMYGQLEVERPIDCGAVVYRVTRGARVEWSPIVMGHTAARIY